MAVVHPTRRFTLAALNAAFAADFDHSRDHDWAAGVDPRRPLASIDDDGRSPAIFYHPSPASLLGWRLTIAVTILPIVLRLRPRRHLRAPESAVSAFERSLSMI
jgi:hypothetical protein